MVFYHFYVRDKDKGDKLIGILPERRSTLERIDMESVTKWLKATFGNNLEHDDVYFTVTECVRPNGDPCGQRETSVLRQYTLPKGTDRQ